VPPEHEEQLAGHRSHLPSTNVAPSLHYKQIDVLANWHSIQRPCSHLKQAPVSAVREKGNLQVRQEEVFPESQVAQGSSHWMQVEPANEKGGLQAVHSVAEFSHCEQGGVHGVHDDDPFKKYPSLQTVQTLPLHYTQPGGHLTQSV